MSGTKTLLYQILKSIEAGKEPALEDFEGATIGSFHSALEQIIENKLAHNVSFSHSGKGKKTVLVAHTNGSVLTAQGINYIHMQESRSF
ncbi:hypothetical protein H1230_20695 [Paenibacillus sp. 19GGS1-52]|uniref:hypothetical protein n=1 Tax=Paenibacillus sp. 19GGS1-52 TaxID=2758563 RepID=UPI001EFBF90F|nr:hypothetical protein [Paenibacillus sp. 19GGS1-52]ULO05487.1 hypothetical protein H1230_20695 [Paenibacillus sp. 19GGS1-52]